MNRQQAIERVILTAAREVGVREVGNSNTGRRVQEYQDADPLDGTGYPWCASFVSWVLLTALGKAWCDKVWKRSASCDEILGWARRNKIISTVPTVGSAGLVMASKNDAIHIFLTTKVLAESVNSIEGNAQPLTSKVLTPTGWVNMGDLKIGDQLIDPAGSPSKVAAIYLQGEKDVYRLTLSDGSTVESTYDHLWFVRFSGEKNYSVVRTEDIAKETMAGRSPQLPPLHAPDFGNGESLPIEPYVLGLLIGDGGLSRKGTVRFTTMDTELLDAIQSAYPQCEIKKIGNTCDYRLVMSERIANPDYNPVRDKLGRLTSESRSSTIASHPLYEEIVKLGLNCTSEFKRIPEQYFWTSAANRLALLQGLLDTDGHADVKGRVEYTTVSRELIEDVLHLVQSLGGSSRIQTKEVTWYTSPNQLTPKRAKTSYRLAIRLPYGVQTFRLERKQARVDMRGKPTRGFPRSIRGVEKIRRDECQCIKVSAPSSMYVTDNFIPTHNTNAGGSRNGNGVYARTRKLSGPYLFVDWPRLLPAALELPDGAYKVAPQENSDPFANVQMWDLFLGSQKVAKIPLFEGRSYVPAWKWATWFKQTLGWDARAQAVTLNGQVVPSQARLFVDEKGQRRAWVRVDALAAATQLQVTSAAGKVMVTR